MWDLLKDSAIPIWLKVLAFLAIVLPLIYSGVRLVRSFSKTKGKDIFKDITSKDLLKHDFFRYLDDLSNSNIRTVSLVDRERTNVMKILLSYKLSVFQKRFKEFLIECDYSKDHREVSGRFVALIYTSITEYEELFKAEALNDEERDTAQIILDKFHKEDFKAGDDSIDIIERIFNSDISKMSIHGKIYNSLYTMMFPFTALFNDALVTLHDLNGELTGRTFKGKEFKAL